MGLFRDLRDINRMGKEMRGNQPMPSVRESVGQAREMMEQAQGQMAAAQLLQDPNARQGTATVLAIRDTGMTVNENPSVELDLEVTDAGGFTYRVTTRQIVSRLRVGQLQPGSAVSVVVDGTDRNRLALL